MSKEYTETKRIKTYDADSTGRLSPVTALKYFQEIANRQLDSLGLGLDYTGNFGLAWVLIKYDISFYRMPKVDEKVYIRTVPTRYRGFEAERTFEIIGEDDKILASGRSIWILLNIETEKFARMEEIEGFQILESERRRPEKIEKLKNLPDWDFEVDRIVYYTDIDINRHVNNTVYLRLALDALPISLLENYRLERLKISFISQAFAGDTLTLRVKETEPHHYRVDILGDGAEVAKLDLKFSDEPIC